MYTGQIDHGYPRPMSVWRIGPPGTQIDAAFQAFNSRTYFFAGENYYRFNDARFRVDDTYPRGTAFWWFGCGENLEAMTTPVGGRGSLTVSAPHAVAVIMSFALALLHLFNVV